MANFLAYGLTPGRGRDISRAMNTALRLKTGYVWIDSVNAHGRAMHRGAILLHRRKVLLV